LNLAKSRELLEWGSRGENGLGLEPVQANSAGWTLESRSCDLINLGSESGHGSGCGLGTLDEFTGIEKYNGLLIWESGWHTHTGPGSFGHWDGCCCGFRLS